MLTAFLLLKVDRAAEAYEFAELADQSVQQLIKSKKRLSIEVRKGVINGQAKNDRTNKSITPVKGESIDSRNMGSP